MGPDHGPGFVQEYTNAIRIFTVSDDGVTINITHYTAHVDSINLHRRDYNAEPQILPDGSEGITMFSGVFRSDIDLPYLNAVNVDSTMYSVNDTFQQLYNHYHCPSLPLYSSVSNTMYTVFFGGIAQYYQDSGMLVQDDNVPFVKTIAAVIRDENGTMIEEKLPIEMPSLLGAGAEFIPINSNPQYGNHVFNIDAFSGDSVLLGYIFGGISSTATNIFFINDGTQSSASHKIFKVYYKKKLKVNIKNIPIKNDKNVNLLTYPNPNKGIVNIQFNLNANQPVHITLYNSEFQTIQQKKFDHLKVGKNEVKMAIPSDVAQAVYFISVETENGKSTTKVILE